MKKRSSDVRPRASGAKAKQDTSPPAPSSRSKMPKSARPGTVATRAAGATQKKGGTLQRRAGRRPTPDAPRPSEILARLAETYPHARCALDHTSAYQLLVATILSAQCTDKRVNMVTPALFASYPTPAALAEADQADVERLIQSTGFFRSKAKNLIAMAQALVERHGGEVPCDMEALVQLPGVGRKTANVVLGNAFGVNDGIVVDTHVGRLSRRLGFTRHDDPVKVEQDLVPLFPRERWTMLAHYLIEHGRAVCDARKPRCGECPLRDLCPSSLV